MVKLLRSSVPTSIDLRQDITSDGQVMADPTQIHQVLMNLCTNAVQAMEATGGTLRIGVAEMDLLPAAERLQVAPPPGRCLEISVADTGHGIAQENLQAIFEPYFTTKGIGEGTGLGLSVVHGIVTGCGGEIRVASEPGRGTRFTVRLPLVDDRQSEETLTEAADLPGGGERILIVDDELMIAKMLEQTLGGVGYRTTTRTSSVEALALFQHKGDQFDMMITDMTMPNMTGDLLAAEVLKCRPDLPVILCTGYSKRISDEAVTSLGIKALLMKPFSKGEILNLVRRILDRELQ